MSINSKVKYKTSENDYPKLIKNPLTPGLIVLFENPGVGTVVSLPEDNTEELFIGNQSQWANDSRWVDFEGEIILSNN